MLCLLKTSKTYLKSAIVIRSPFILRNSASHTVNIFKNIWDSDEAYRLTLYVLSNLSIFYKNALQLGCAALAACSISDKDMSFIISKKIPICFCDVFIDHKSICRLWIMYDYVLCIYLIII